MPGRVYTLFCRCVLWTGVYIRLMCSGVQTCALHAHSVLSLRPHLHEMLLIQNAYFFANMAFIYTKMHLKCFQTNVWNSFTNVLNVLHLHIYSNYSSMCTSHIYQWLTCACNCFYVNNLRMMSCVHCFGIVLHRLFLCKHGLIVSTFIALLFWNFLVW